MRLDNVKIRRLRGINEGEISGLVDVNILIGRNNCGKSTVAEAISYLAYSIDGSPMPDAQGRLQRVVWSEVRCESHDPKPEMWFRSNTGHPIEIHGTLSTKDEFVRSVGSAITRDQAHIQPIDRRELSAASKATMFIARDFVQRVAVFRPSDGADNRIETLLWKQLLATRKDKVITASINEIFGTNVEALHVLPGKDGKAEMQLAYPQYSLPIDVQGDGTRTALRCLMVLADRNNTMMILEEPECHQHPGSLAKFASAMCKQARGQGVQLLLTTHSLECVRAFLAGAGAAGAEAAVFHLKLEEGQLQSRKLESDTFDGLEDAGLDVRCLDLYV